MDRVRFQFELLWSNTAAVVAVKCLSDSPKFVHVFRVRHLLTPLEIKEVHYCNSTNHKLVGIFSSPRALR